MIYLCFIAFSNEFNIFNTIFLSGLYWLGLGLLSTIGFGFGFHTGIFFLFPYIINEYEQSTINTGLNISFNDTISLNTCSPIMNNTIFKPNILLGVGSTMFNSTDIYKPPAAHPFPNNTDYVVYPSYIYIIFKCLPQIILWGVGSALGELPPYLLAYDCKDIDIDFIKNKNINRLYEKIKSLFDFNNPNVIFTSILLMASWPNLTFDMCGILCGYYNIKLGDFLIPTIIGKTLIKAPLQCLAVLYFYNTDYIIPSYSPLLFNLCFIVVLGFFINKFIIKLSKLELDYQVKYTLT